MQTTDFLSSSRKLFTFGYGTITSMKIPNRDLIFLEIVEKEINKLVSRIQTPRIGENGYLETTNLTFEIYQKPSLIVKSILNQFEINYYERKKWCGLKRYTILVFDRIIPKLIYKYKYSRDNSLPLEKIISNPIHIRIK